MFNRIQYFTYDLLSNMLLQHIFLTRIKQFIQFRFNRDKYTSFLPYAFTQTERFSATTYYFSKNFRRFIVYIITRIVRMLACI